MKTSIDTESENASRSTSEQSEDAHDANPPAAELDAVTVYLRELVERPALTRDEERSLTAEIARAKGELARHVRALLIKAADVLEIEKVAPAAKALSVKPPRPARIRAEILEEMNDARLNALAARIDKLATMARESAALLADTGNRTAASREAIARAKKMQDEILHGFGLTAADLMAAWQAIADARTTLTSSRHRLFECNLRLVVSIARRFRNNAVEVGDLIQEGNIALMRAVEAYDPLRNVPFASFAGPVIRRAMAEFVRATGKPVRVPKQFDDLRRRIALAAQYLARRFGRRAREEEVAEYLEMPVRKVVEALVPNERAISLDSSAQDEEATLAESLADPRGVDPTEEVAARRQNEALDQMLTGLKGRDQQVLTMRYGGDATEDVTLEDVGHELGVTRERARQLEARALRGLRLGQTGRAPKKRRPRD